MCSKSMFLISFVLVLGLAGSVAQAQVAAADLLVDLRTSDLEYGTGATTWPNRGLLDDFTAQGNPVVEDVDGKKAVTFDASSWFDGPTSVPEIEGSGTRTIEVWAYNPSIVGEETMVSWAHRGGPGGTNMAFNYSDNSSWGSVGHWGAAADMGYAGANSPAPAVGNWWHLVYTYDGTTARIYVNAAEETVKEVALNTHTGNIIRIGAQGDGSGANIQSGMNFIGSIAEMRIYSRALSQVEIEAAMQGMEAYPYALGPDPKDGTVLEATWITLSWHPGDLAVSHNVYLGDNFGDVNNGTADTFLGNQVDTMVIAGFAGFAFPDGLVPGTTYYWRIDEVNDADPNSPWKGNIWSFWVPPKKAYEAVPADKAQFVLSDVTLEWTAGFNAKLHTVYFGDNFDEVSNASGGVAQTTTTFAPGVLEPEKTYYWRVDEFDPPATHKGDVWSFTTVPEIPITDPNLVGWWKFDEGAGTNALDWSGQGNHGTLVGGPKWIAGYDGDAVKLDGSDDYVTLPIGPVINSLTSSTFTTWVNFSNAGGAWQRIFDFGSGTAINMFLTPRTGTGGPMRFAITIGGGGAAEEQATAPDTLASGWHHIAVTINASTRTSVLYLDGVSIANNIGGAALAPSSLGNTTNNWLGRSQYGADAYFNGSLDDFRIYDYARSQPEIRDTMRGDPLLAWDPSPKNGSNPGLRDAAALSWSAGENAAGHDVYFGTDREEVKDADDSDATGIYRGRQNATTYSPPEGVEWGGGPYYWRVDENSADGTISKGRTWDFAVADFIAVDDFESYNDIAEGEPESNRIYLTWIDGFGTTTNGAFVGNMDVPLTERGNPHGGAQAMPLSYDNNLKISEATMTLIYPRDWTEQGVTKLSLWLRGESANAPERMFVALDGNAVVYYDDPAATQIIPWTEWVIELSAFGGFGVDLTNVSTVTIGFGTKNSPAAGGTGQMYFDNIRLYRP